MSRVQINKMAWLELREIVEAGVNMANVEDVRTAAKHPSFRRGSLLKWFRSSTPKAYEHGLQYGFEIVDILPEKEMAQRVG